MNDQLYPAPAVEREQPVRRLESADEEIVSGLRRGEREAWTTLYDQYSVRVWRYVARLVGPDANSVADIVQDTMLAAAESARSFDDSKGTLWLWLCGIAHNRVSQYWKQEQRWQRVVAKLQEHTNRDGPAFEVLRESTGSPDARLQHQELADIVRLVLSKLPEDYAALLTAKYIDDLSIIEIQQLHGGTSDAVRSRMVRARKMFREMFERISVKED